MTLGSLGHCPMITRPPAQDHRPLHCLVVPLRSRREATLGALVFCRRQPILPQRRLALYLHDSTGINLCVIKLNLEAAAKALKEQSLAAEPLNVSLLMLGDAVKRTRDLTVAKHPQHDDNGPVAAHFKPA